MTLGLASMFSSGMVMQRNLPVRIWGTAIPGQEVSVSIQGCHATTQANDEGAWMCEMGPLAASECEVLEVAAGSATIALQDVAVGEIFVVAGQSNAEFWMRYEKHLPEVLPTCTDSLLRFFDMPKLSYPGQEHDFDYSRMGRWRKATPEDLEFFSALGYTLAASCAAHWMCPWALWAATMEERSLWRG